MLYDQIVLYSPLSPKECHRRLDQALDKWLQAYSGTKPFIGSVSKERLVLRKRLGYRNSFQTQYAATLNMAGDGRGTIIEGRFRLFPSTAIFMIVWFGSLSYFALSQSLPMTFTYVFGEASTLPENWRHLAVGPLIMIFCGMIVVIGCRYFARKEEADIMAFLNTTIDASER
jgi:hypothetical protein